MIDTIKAKIIVPHLGRLMDHYIGEHENFNKVIITNYKLDNIHIKSKEVNGCYELSIIGSLSKFLYKTNLIRFKRIDVKKSVSKLNEMVGVDLSNAVIKRVDIAANLSMKYSPRNYMNLLVKKSRFQRTSYNDNETVYFFTASKELVFYSKEQQFKDKDSKYNPELKAAFSSFLKDKNLIRYEVKLKKILGAFKNGVELKLKDLYNNGTYKDLINIWYDQYQSVVKDNLTAFKSFWIFRTC